MMTGVGQSIYNAKGKYRFLYWLAALVVFVYILIEASGEGDYWVFLAAAKRLQEGGDIYGTKFGDGYHFFYGTLFALVLIPFTYLPSFIIRFLWLLAGLFFLFRTWKIVKEYLDVKIFSDRQYWWFVILGWGFTFRFLYNNFHVIQMTIFLLYASLEGINLITKNKKIAGAALLALAIHVKTLPIVLVPYLIYRKELKAVGYVIIFIVIFFLLPSLFIGHDHNMFLLKEWFALINPSRPIHMIDIDETGFHSLSAWIPTLLMENTSNNFTLPLKRNILNLDIQQVTIILTAARVLLVLFVFYFLRTMPFKSAPSRLHTFWEMSYIFLLIPLIFPHQHVYAFYFLFPAGIYIVYFLMVQRKNAALKGLIIKSNVAFALLLLSFLLLSIGGIIGTIDAFTQHYKFITYGSLILIIPLAILKPAHLITLPDKNI